MSKRDKSERQGNRKVVRRIPKKRKPLRHPGRILAIALAVVTVVTAALVWGNILKQRSDQYRADKEAGLWTLPAETQPTQDDTSVSSAIHLLEISPEGNVGDIIIYNSHDGVLLPLRDADGRLHYTSDTAKEASLAVPADAPSLTADTKRIRNRGLYVVGVYHLTCFSAADDASQIYRRGLDLALLREYAEAGMDELLLFGLPTGSDENDALSTAFLQELRTSLSTLSSPPMIGVALPLSAFAEDTRGTDLPSVPADETTPYIGNLSCGRLSLAADHLALDLRSVTAEEMETILPEIGYIYLRHSLRLLTDKGQPTIAEDALSHGFGRVYEMRAGG